MQGVTSYKTNISSSMARVVLIAVVLVFLFIQLASSQTNQACLSAIGALTAEQCNSAAAIYAAIRAEVLLILFSTIAVLGLVKLFFPMW